MADRLKEIPGKVLEWWNKFTKKQKTIITIIVAAVIMTFVILVYTFTRPQFTRLGTYDNSAEAAKIMDLLDDAGITYRSSTDLRTIEVESGSLTQANYVLAASGYSPNIPSYEDYVSSSMSATSTDKNNQYTVYLQAELAHMLEQQDIVEKATVLIHRPPEYGTLASQQEEASASVTLEVKDTVPASVAASLARVVQSFLHTTTTANITIVDQHSNLIFAGGDDYSMAGIANSYQELRNQAESMVASQVQRVLAGTNQYGSIAVTSHLDIDFSEYQEYVQEYYANADRDEGMYAHRDTFSSEGTNGVSGLPGTDSNDGNPLNTYVNPDSANSEYSQNEESIDYLPNQRSWTSSISPGSSINYNNSSIAISLISYREYYEENVRSQGLLDGGLSWSDFKEANRRDIRLEVDEDFYRLVATATGIDVDNIAIIAYESPIFYDRQGMSISGTDILSIVMIILILALLGFVVLRSMGSRKEVEEEEELSVESMLQSTQESALENLDVETKSETRLLVEKFVDDNPEAAANLLRNWLNEDWN